LIVGTIKNQENQGSSRKSGYRQKGS